MAYTLNTSHALYGNIVELIGVQGGALISHKTARTFTKHADATYGTGTYGEHFSAAGSGYSIKGASISPAIVIDTYTNPNYSVLVVLNAKPLGGNRNVAFLNNNGGNYTLVGPAWSNSNLSAAATAYTNTLDGATTLGTGEVMLTTTRSEGAGNAKLYVNASLDGSGTPEGWNANATINYIGGYDGQAGYSASVVWIVVFNKVLSQSEISDLYASLGANNAFGLVQSSGGSASTAISATLSNITGSVASKSNPKTAISATLANVTASVGHTTGTLKTTIAATLGNVAGAITSTGSTANGTFTSEALKDYAGNVLANTALNFVRFYNDTTGALVLNKTGVTTNGSGIVTFSDASLVAGITYRVDWETAAGSRRMPRKAAA